VTEEAVEIRVSRGQGNSSGEIARMFRATRCVAIYAAKTCLSTEWQMIASGTWSNANYRKLLSKRFRRSRPKSTMRLNLSSYSSPEAEPAQHTEQRLFTAAGAFASDSSGAWPALQGGHIELVQTVGIADPVNGYDLATGNGEAPITLMGCPSSTMRASAALISKILGPRD